MASIDAAEVQGVGRQGGGLEPKGFRWRSGTGYDWRHCFAICVFVPSSGAGSRLHRSVTPSVRRSVSPSSVLRPHRLGSEPSPQDARLIAPAASMDAPGSVVRSARLFEAIVAIRGVELRGLAFSSLRPGKVVPFGWTADRVN